MLTVVTFLWHGWRPVYNSHTVNTWARQLHEKLSIPFRAVCITDKPGGIDTRYCETFPLWPEWKNLGSVGIINCFRRIKLLDPAIQEQIGGEWFLQLDQDCVIEDDLAPILDRSVPFQIVKGKHARYNGSMWCFQKGALQHVYDNFDPKLSPKKIMQARHNGKRIIGSDQAWFSIAGGDLPTWSAEDGVLSYLQHRDKLHKGRIWFFAGSVKPWSKAAQVKAPRLYEQYMATWKRVEGDMKDEK